MPHEKHYECLRRVIGICGFGCGADDNNLNCPYYYPCHRMGSSSEIITYEPSQARAIQSELLAKAKVAHSSTRSVVSAVSVDSSLG